MHFAPKLEQLEKRFEELNRQMADPAVIADGDQYRKVTKAHSELSESVARFREWKKIQDSLSQARQMLQDSDPELKAMAEEEISSLPSASVEETDAAIAKAKAAGPVWRAIAPADRARQPVAP